MTATTQKNQPQEQVQDPQIHQEPFRAMPQRVSNYFLLHMQRFTKDYLSDLLVAGYYRVRVCFEMAYDQGRYSGYRNAFAFTANVEDLLAMLKQDKSAKSLLLQLHLISASGTETNSLPQVVRAYVSNSRMQERRVVYDINDLRNVTTNKQQVISVSVNNL